MAPHGRQALELDKFKRRLIRNIARLLINEKKPEEEIREALKKETGCDCRNIWMRLKALTLKKLQRLLDADDRPDGLPHIARMTMTDWLLVDLVLVHQDDIDFIGKEHREDRETMVYLNELVKEFDIEMKHGDDLAHAWANVAMKYNQSGRTCSPMLLQRRWYQLKEEARESFYNFWFQYRGVLNRLSLASKPSPLMTEIAKQNKQLVICQFTHWQELIEQKCVIMPDQFEDLMKGKLPKAPMSPRKHSEEEPPDLVMIEPNIETINLADSDKEDTEHDTEKAETTQIDTAIKIKEEPVDMDIEEETFLISTAEKKTIYEEVLEALEKEDIDRDDMDYECLNANLTNKDIAIIDDSSTQETIAASCENSILSINSIDKETDDIVPIVNLDSVSVDKSVASNDVVPINDDVLTSNNSNTKTNDNIAIDTNDVIAAVNDDVTPIIHRPGTINKNVSISDDSDVAIVDDTIHMDNENALPSPENIVLPQITNVFGNVNVTNETIGQLAALANINDIAKAIESPKLIVDDPEPIPVVKEEIDVEQYVKIKIEENDLNVQHKKENTFSIGELSNDINFGDDGIELLDDGIAFVDDDDDEEETKADPLTNAIKAVLEKAVNHAEETSKIDKKLLLCPVVYTPRLEQMGLPYISSFEQINDKLLIEIISSRSKPPKQKIIESGSEDNVNEKIIENNILKQSDNKICDIVIKQEYPTEQDRDETVLEEDQEESDEEKYRRIKLTSYMLRKPRNRKYNPILLCKNPDFNTRLKRLNFGFFGYPNNRDLLKTCRPLTIDLSKAFEKELVNGTLYLENTGIKRPNIKKEVVKDIEHENLAIPSSSAHIHINNTSSSEISPIIEADSTRSTSVNKTPLTCERNKVIILPDISQVRRINQRLLTAEVTPLQVGNNHVPVSLVPSSAEKTPEPSQPKKVEKEDALRAMVERAENEIQPVFTAKKQTVPSRQPSVTYARNKDGSVKYPLKKLQAHPWQPKHNSTVPWLQWPARTERNDSLLTIDTLNKMLYLLSSKDDEDAALLHCSKSKKSKTWKKKNLKNSKDTKPTSIETKQVTNDKKNINKQTDDVQVVTEPTKAPQPKIKILSAGSPSRPENKSTGYNKLTSKYCCWSRKRIYELKFFKIRTTRHDCPNLCQCCCKNALRLYVIQELEENCHKLNNIDDRTCAEFIRRRIEGDTRPTSNMTVANGEGIEDLEVESEVVIGNISSSIPVGPKMEKQSPKASTSQVVTIDLDADDCPTDLLTPAQNAPSVPVALTENSSIVQDLNSETPSSDLTAIPETIGNPILTSVKPVTENVVESSIETNNSAPIDLDIDSPATLTRNTDVIVTSDAVSSAHTITYNTNIEPEKDTITQPLINIELRIEPPINPAVTNKPTNAASDQQKHIAMPINKVLSFNKRNAKKQHDSEVTMRVYTQPKAKTSDNTSSVRTYKNMGQQRSYLKPRIIPKNQMVNGPPAPAVHNIADNSREKIIYLNEKSQKNKSDLPIHLGDKKILLTTVKFPRILKQLEVATMNPANAPPMCLPKGVTLSLLPNGQVTYTLDPHITVDPQELALLPDIISLIQKQINETIMSQSLSLPTHVIPLQQSAAQVPTIVEASIDISTSMTAAKTDKTCQIDTPSEPVSLVDNESENVSDQSLEKPSNISNNIVENDVSEKDLGEKDVDLNKEVSEVPDIAISADAATECSEISNKSDDTKKDEPHRMIENNETTQKPEEPNKNPSTDSTENLTSEIKPASKNILSDLMEMSGISEEDFAPAPQVVSDKNQYITVSPLIPQNSAPELQGASILDQFVCSQAYLGDQFEEYWPTIDTPCGKLTPVTSLIQLKYAYAHDGIFYKLDLEKGYLIPINVCIKQKPKDKMANPALSKLPPKSIIDLTDDDNTPEPTSTQSVSPDADTTQSLSKGSLTRRVDLGEGRSLLIGNQKVKPVRLFKSAIPNILRSQLKERYRQVFQKRFITDGNTLLKKSNRVKKRKSNVEISLDSEGSDNVMSIDSDGSDDSDNEPLSNKAKRKRDGQTHDQVKQMDVDPNRENARDDIGIDSSNKEEQMDTETISNVPMTETSDTVGEEDTLGSKTKDIDNKTSIELENEEENPVDVNIPENIQLIEEPLQFDDDSQDEEPCILGV